MCLIRQWVHYMLPLVLGLVRSRFWSFIFRQNHWGAPSLRIRGGNAICTYLLTAILKRDLFPIKTFIRKIDLQLGRWDGGDLWWPLATTSWAIWRHRFPPTPVSLAWQEGTDSAKHTNVACKNKHISIIPPTSGYFWRANQCHIKTDCPSIIVL